MNHFPGPMSARKYPRQVPMAQLLELVESQARWRCPFLAAPYLGSSLFNLRFGHHRNCHRFLHDWQADVQAFHPLWSGHLIPLAAEHLIQMWRTKPKAPIFLSKQGLEVYHPGTKSWWEGDILDSPRSTTGVCGRKERASSQRWLAASGLTPSPEAQGVPVKDILVDVFPGQHVEQRLESK